MNEYNTQSISGVDDDDFYMILPSNSNPLIHPTNQASSYTVSWETPIFLNDLRKWKVGLTEMTYCYCPITADRTCGIKILKRKKHFVSVTFQMLSWDMKIVPREITIAKKVEEPKNVQYEFPKIFHMHNKMQFESEKFFKIIFPTMRIAKGLGFSKLKYNATFNKDSQKYVLTGENEIYMTIKYYDKMKKQDIIICDNMVAKIFTHHYDEKYEYYLDNEHKWDTAKEMISHLEKKFKNKYFDISLINDKSGKNVVQLLVKKDIVDLEFLNGFNYVLGFHKRKIENIKANTKLDSQHPPHLDRGFTNMYVYSNICSPIQVGHMRVPLLKSIWIDINKESKKTDEIRYMSIKHPMYIPVSSSSINSIEINIRTDSGILVPFIDSAVTSLTLHFKKV